MTDDPTTEETMRAAIAEIRREGYKAAGLHALVDAVLLALASNLAVSVLGGSWVDRGIDLAGPVSVTVGTALVAVTGIGVFAVELAVRTRRPLVERFEAANPAVDEALRTARDAIERDEDSRIARALYADVIERLRATSSLGLVHTRRLAASVVLVVVLSIATIHVSAIALDVSGSGPPAPSGSEDGVTGGPAQRTPASTELRSGEEVLGDPEDVTAGSENLSAPVTVERGGPGDEAFEQFEPDGESRDSTGGEVRRAGYAPPDDIENVDLIREYNLRIRDDNDE